jgi:hypothetical protein
MSDLAEVHGPIDVVVLEFPNTDNMRGEAAAALLDLVDQGIVSIYDLLIVKKEEDGSFSGINISDLSSDDLGGFVAFAGARSGLLGDDDLAAAGELMTPGSVAALIVYENTWARGFVAGVRAAGGELVASTRIPATDVMAALDELEAG